MSWDVLILNENEMGESQLMGDADEVRASKTDSPIPSDKIFR